MGGMKGATREGAGSGKMRIEAETEKGVDGGEGREVGVDHEHGSCAEAEGSWNGDRVAATDAGGAGRVAVFFFFEMEWRTDCGQERPSGIT